MTGSCMEPGKNDKQDKTIIFCCFSAHSVSTTNHLASHVAPVVLLAYKGTKMILFGGKGAEQVGTGSIYILDLPTMVWSQGPNLDALQNRSHMACGVSGDSFVVVGGMITLKFFVFFFFLTTPQALTPSCYYISHIHSLLPLLTFSLTFLAIFITCRHSPHGSKHHFQG